MYKRFSADVHIGIGAHVNPRWDSDTTRTRLHALDIPLDQAVGTLSGGQRAQVALALALAKRPRLLLLDEPVAGVPDSDRHEILDTVASLPEDVTVVLIEHDMDLVFSFANRISVLVNGALFVEGTTSEIARDPRVKAVYLGEEAVHVG